MRVIQKPTFAHWVALITLVIAWGSAFLAAEVSLREMTPLASTVIRVLLAALALYGYMRLRGHRLPTDRRSWSYFFAMAIVGNALPFFLSTWGQVYIDSGLAGILMAVMPLSVLLLAHWFLPDEPMTGERTLGFLVGLAGVVILTGPDALRAIGGNALVIIAQLAVLLSAVCYGASAVITRHAPDHPPMVTAAGVMIAAGIVLTPIWLVTEPLPDPASLTLWPVLAVVALGLFSTGFAAIVFFYLIAETGAGFQSLINFLIPPWAVLLGVVVLNEALPARAYVAMAVILVSLWLTQRSTAAISEARDPA